MAEGAFGTAFGFILTAVPVYVSECAPDKHRGKLIVLFELFLSIASCGAYVGALALQEILVEDDDNPDTPKGWRYMAGSVGIPGLLLLLVCTRIPESARWHVMRGEYDEAPAASGVAGVFAALRPMNLVGAKPALGWLDTIVRGCWLGI